MSLLLKFVKNRFRHILKTFLKIFEIIQKMSDSHDEKSKEDSENEESEDNKSEEEKKVSNQNRQQNKGSTQDEARAAWGENDKKTEENEDDG